MIESCAAIVIAAKHHELTKVKDTRGTTNTVGALRCRFEFRTSDWDFSAKTAMFCNGDAILHPEVADNAIAVPLDADNECAVPYEVLTDLLPYSIGVWGATADGLRIVSRWLVFGAQLGCYTEGSAPADPEPTIYEQILVNSQNAVNTANEVLNMANSGELDGKSAYELACDEGFEGSQSEWVASLGGIQGERGVGIAEITKIATENNVDIYQLIYTDGNKTTFEITNGKDGADGVSVSKSEINAQGELVIYYSNGTSTKLGKVVGADGTSGKDGKSAYEVAINNGFKGTEKEWLETLKGEDGEAGPQGEKGEQGVQGIQGEKGDKGDPGEQGKPGEAGYTPQKRIDYFTESDKQEIVEDVTSQLPVDNQLSTTSENPVQNKIITKALSDKQDTLTFDDTVIEGSTNPVTSDGIFKEFREFSGAYDQIISNGLGEVNGRVDDVSSKLDDVESIAKGANPAEPFADYYALVGYFNTLDDPTKHFVGQNIFIRTMGVPDLWISYIEPTFMEYTFYGDESFVNELKTNNYVQIGYYTFSMLETQKVDLTDYAKTEDLDKYVKRNTDTRAVVTIYARDTAGKDKHLIVGTSSSTMSNSNIAQYWDDTTTMADIEPYGCLVTRTPKKDYHCAPKKYVDDLVGDISTALTELHDYAEALKGGDSV